MFHGQWLEPGSHTIQEEAAHPNSLYLILECADIPIGAIVSKCNVQPFHHALSLPTFDIYQPNNFFTRSDDIYTICFALLIHPQFYLGQRTLQIHQPYRIHCEQCTQSL